MNVSQARYLLKSLQESIANIHEARKLVEDIGVWLIDARKERQDIDETHEDNQLLDGIAAHCAGLTVKLVDLVSSPSMNGKHTSMEYESRGFQNALAMRIHDMGQLP